MAHSPIGPSAAHRWLVCPGSVALSAGLDEGTSSYAREGQCAHALAEHCLRTQQMPAAFIGKEFEQWIVDPDMPGHVTTYLRTLHEVYGFGSNETGIETYEAEVNFGAEIGQPGETGTADAIRCTLDELQVHDLKYGKGVQVYARDNPQLMLYALGALRDYGVLFDPPKVRVVIHQPRLDHVDEWTYTREELEEFRQKATAQAALACSLLANPGDAPKHLNPDPEACRWCKAKAKCPALTGLVSDSVKADITAEEFSELSPSEVIGTASIGGLDRLATLYSRVPLIRDWCQAVEDEMRLQLSRGEPVPGFKLVKGRAGARAWADEEIAEQVLKTMRLKSEQLYSSRLASPAAIEKILGDQPRRWEKVKPLIVQGEGKPTIAPAHDKRPALDMTKVEFTDAE